MRVNITLMLAGVSAGLLLLLAAPRVMALDNNVYSCTGANSAGLISGSATSAVAGVRRGTSCVTGGGQLTLNFADGTSETSTFNSEVDESGGCPDETAYLRNTVGEPSTVVSTAGQGFYKFTSGPLSGCTLGVQYGSYNGLTEFLFDATTPYQGSCSAANQGGILHCFGQLQ